MSSSLIRGRYILSRATGRESIEMFEDAALFQRDSEIVFADGQPTHFDSAAVVAELRERFAKPRAPREELRCAIAHALRPYVREFYRSWH